METLSWLDGVVLEIGNRRCQSDANNNRLRLNIRQCYHGTSVRQVDVIELHHQPMNLNPSHSSVEHFLGLGVVGVSSNDDDTNGTSGTCSLDRDARLDLGTSRGSSGGREDVDEHDEYRLDTSDLSNRRTREE